MNLNSDTLSDRLLAFLRLTTRCNSQRRSGIVIAPESLEAKELLTTGFVEHVVVRDRFWSVVASDINGDGRQDLVANRDGRISWFENLDGLRSFQPDGQLMNKATSPPPCATSVTSRTAWDRSYRWRRSASGWKNLGYIVRHSSALRECRSTFAHMESIPTKKSPASGRCYISRATPNSFVGHPEANGLLGREYRRPFVVPTEAEI